MVVIGYEELLAFPSMKGAKVVAGENGLDRPIRWTQVLEFEEIEDWVCRGALIFVTGAASSQWKSGLPALVKQAAHGGASGMVVFLGPYITAISDEVISFCNQEEFPLLTVPIDVKTYEVSYELAQALFRRGEQQGQAAVLLHELMGRGISAESEHFLEQQGFMGPDFMAGILLLPEQVEESSNRLLAGLSAAIQRLCYQWRSKAITIAENNRLYILLSFAQDWKEDGFFSDLTAYTATISDKPLFLLTGNRVSCVCGLFDSLYQARKCIPLAKRAEMDAQTQAHTWICYESLGTERLLLNLDPGERADFCRDQFGPLLLPEHAELMQTLLVYLKNDKNLTQSADALYIHVNTMKNRIHKIEELLSCDLHDPLTTHALYSAYICLWLAGTN